MSAPTQHPLTDAVGPVDTGFELDAECAAAVDLARAAAAEVARFDAATGDAGDVGDHLWVRPEGERVVTHAFEATLRGYRGWYWAVTVGRAPGHAPTVDEVVLLPGSAALLAPAWVPWAERVRVGDLSPGDVLETKPDDPRLIPGYLQSDDPQVEQVAFELGIGRVRVLSRYGRLDAADRWYAGDGGPNSPMAQQAPAHCGTCGFFLSVAGSLSAGFGVCANEISESDGRIVSVEHGCGAHSEAAVDTAGAELGEVFDDEQIEVVSLRDAGDDSAQTSADAEPAADLGEQSVVAIEFDPVEAEAGDHAGGVEAEHQPSGEQVADTDRTQPERPATIAGGVEEAASADPRQDAPVERWGEDLSAAGDDSDIATGGFQHDRLRSDSVDEEA